jgi:hypothetical protein
MMSYHTALLLADSCVADRLRSRMSGRPPVHTAREPLARASALVWTGFKRRSRRQVQLDEGLG